jgi:formylglycine-generating enzyme required for sulfatase activity
LRFLQFIAVAALALACALAPAQAEKRVALVVGNGAYVHADRLANPVNDARGMRDALASLKFDVIYGEDLDLKALRRMLGRFAGAVGDADVALVYFAGHGATFGDVPYVVPVDAEFSRLDEMPAELVAVEDLIGDLRRAKSVRIAILDACRDNGAEQALKRSRGSASRGLAPPKNPAGLIIAYATQHGAIAADSAGAGNSPFTAALLHNIATPGLDVKDMFFKVGSEVEAATSSRQRPEISISMYEQYALAPSAPNQPPARPPGESVATDAERAAGAERTWMLVKDTASLAVLDDFIARFGDVPIYGPLARTRREEVGKLAKVVTPAPPPPPQSDAPLTAERERALKPKDTFRECADCPEMVVVPAGTFSMGSPAKEKDNREDSERPQHVVNIGRQFAVGRFHVTRDQFATFVSETGYAASKTCYKWPSLTSDGSWRDPGFVQEGSHPVVCVSWDDANAYANWLAKKTGKPYRLLSEAEWEYATRGRTSPGAYPRFWFGNGEKDLCRHGNGLDEKARDAIAALKDSTVAPCNDGYVYTSPVGHYAPNDFGLHDMAGNAWQWTADCFHYDYKGAPPDGSAWTAKTCEFRIVRGGAWNSDPWYLRAAKRDWYTGEGNNAVGFRLARPLMSAGPSGN